MRSFQMVKAESIDTALVINPNREKAVDLQIHTTVTDFVPAANVPAVIAPAFGLVVPAEEDGDELVVRLCANPYTAFNNTTLTLLGIGSIHKLDFNMDVAVYPAMFEFLEDAGSKLVFPALNPTPGTLDPLEANGNPKMAILRWTGMRWLVVAKSRGITLSF